LLDNGFESTVYWTVDEVKAHAKRFSQSFKSGYGPWKDNFDAMAKKTVMKLNISKNGPLDISLKKAIESDQGVIRDDGKIDFIDGDEMVQENTVPQAAIDEINDATSPEQLDEIMSLLTVPQQKEVASIVDARLKALKTVKK
jgi:recombination protein RecT